MWSSHCEALTQSELSEKTEARQLHTEARKKSRPSSSPRRGARNSLRREGNMEMGEVTVRKRGILGHRLGEV